MKLITDRKTLQSLTTKRLLSYKNRLLKVPEGPNWDGETSGTGSINKTQPSWKSAYLLVKEVLSKREHISRV